MWKYWDDLYITKLAQHPLRQILDHVRSVFESSRVETNFFERTCLAVLLIQVQDNDTKIHLIQMRPCENFDNLTLHGNKHYDMWVPILNVYNPITPSPDCPKKMQ